MGTKVDIEEVSRKELLMTLELRLAGYDILRSLFVVEPTKEFVNHLYLFKPMEYFPYTELCSDIHKGVREVQEFFQNQSILENEVFESLHWDYTRMFIGPEKPTAPPWASTYLNKEGLLFQEETLNVRRAYIKYEFLPAQYHQEADDHIGLELDFMYQLTKMCIQSLDESDQRRTNAYLVDQGIFLDNHLLSWVDSFCKNIRDTANTNFYKGFSSILQGFLKQDKKLIKELVQLIN